MLPSFFLILYLCIYARRKREGNKARNEEFSDKNEREKKRVTRKYKGTNKEKGICCKAGYLVSKRIKKYSLKSY